MWQGVEIKTKTEVSTRVTVNGHEINEVLDLACELAHSILEETSHMRNIGELPEHYDLSSEGTACRFLDMVGD